MDALRARRQQELEQVTPPPSLSRAGDPTPLPFPRTLFPFRVPQSLNRCPPPAPSSPTQQELERLWSVDDEGSL